MILHPLYVMKKQFYNDNFVKWDIIIRYIAARHYLQTGEIHKIYDKFCYIRAKFLNPEGYLRQYDTNEQFIKIIESLKKHSYIWLHRIYLDRDWLLQDGAHRLAAALALNIDEVYCNKMDYKIDLDLRFNNLNWYKIRFNNNEYKMMLKAYKELMNDKN